MEVTNILPREYLTIETEIPSNNPNYLQNFNNSLTLDGNKFNYISNLSFVINSDGLYNIPTNESVQIRTNNPLYNTSGAPVGSFYILLKPGHYSLDDILLLFNKGNTTFPLLSISKNNQHSHRVILNFYPIVQSIRNVGVDINFTKAPALQQIMGFYDPINKNIIRYCNSRFLVQPVFSRYPDGLYILAVSNTELLAPELYASSSDLLVCCVGCDLIDRSNLVSQEYVAILHIKTGKLLYYSFDCNIPLSKLNIGSINWTLQTPTGQPYIILTPIEIYTTIVIQDK